MAKDNYKEVSQNFKSKPVVNGKTVIDHKLRSKLGIGCNAYVILDYFKKGEKLDYDKIAKKTGFNDSDAGILIESMLSKNFLIKVKSKDIIKSSSIFYDPKKIKNQFDQFWDLSSISTIDKTKAWPDSKMTAKRMFEEAIELESFNYIMERRNLYIRHLEMERYMFKNIMSATRFLNVRNKEYNTEFDVPKQSLPTIPGSESITKEMIDKQYE